MKPVRWTIHALGNLNDPEIDRAEADKTLKNPDFAVPGQASLRVFMRRYYDQTLKQEMLIRLVVEETATEKVVITVYKTSQIEKYLKGIG